MHAFSSILTAAIALSGPDGSLRDEVEVRHCNVVLEDDVLVAAQEAGVLTAIDVEQGDYVDKDSLLAQIDDGKAQAAKRVAEAEHKEAQAEAESDVSVRYSKAAAEVAHQDFALHQKAEEKSPGSTPKAEMRKLKFQEDKAVLEIEKAQLERDVAGLTAEAKEAAVKAADDDIDRRKVKAPFTGEVVEVGKQRGEWVNPGDMVVHLIRVNKMKISGELKIDEVHQSEVDGRPVRVVAPLTKGRTEEFEGKVVYTDPRVQAGGVYRVVAEVENRREGGEWLLPHGIQVEMFVQTAAPVHAKQARSGKPRSKGE
jgi:macrolide-specific efflux system membrane fusion protein